MLGHSTASAQPPCHEHARTVTYGLNVRSDGESCAEADRCGHHRKVTLGRIFGVASAIKRRPIRLSLAIITNQASALAKIQFRSHILAAPDSLVVSWTVDFRAPIPTYGLLVNTEDDSSPFKMHSRVYGATSPDWTTSYAAVAVPNRILFVTQSSSRVRNAARNHLPISRA